MYVHLSAIAYLQQTHSIVQPKLTNSFVLFFVAALIFWSDNPIPNAQDVTVNDFVFA